ncbi:SMI1 / KNR4 family protein [Planctopirus ephydatiae]|uniref:SMI1 / KNR4 family protein n=1 Tax=Planctopirus ephydatiae TaxID=2528019 RepID=A0A518GQD9_9PLAN|nr:SMI1/KNR4 family protein [Planctopirus ephydatiae]QDV30838.1 SMI1 / KNR4 family protein [Planctopirus ephydatiae]
MPESDADSVIDAIRKRLIAIADNPPYRYVNTSTKDRAVYEANKRSFTGYTEQQIAAAETALNVRFPTVYRSYLRIMGVTHGDLFCGSSVASINDYSDHRKFAEELINESDVKWQLDEKAVVFLEHQGYMFCYFIADGSFDSPIHQYFESDESAKQCSAGFAEMLDAEVALAEQNNRNFRESGGYFLTVQDGYVSHNHPARASGVRPLDLADECPHDSDTVLRDSPSRPWWRFWQKEA